MLTKPYLTRTMPDIVRKYSQYGVVQWSVLGFTYRSTASSAASMVWCSGVCWALLIEVQPCSQYGVVQWSVLGFTYRSTASMGWYSGVYNLGLYL
eukprot:sb/3479271/